MGLIEIFSNPTSQKLHLPYLNKMKKLYFTGFLIVSSALFYSSCAYNHIENPTNPCDQFAGTTCDTTVLYTYKENIGPMMEESCNACHDGNTGNAPVLNDSASLHNYVTDCSLRKKFEDAIQHTSADNSKFMPQGDEKLPDEKISMLKNWICQGAR